MPISSAIWKPSDRAAGTEPRLAFEASTHLLAAVDELLTWFAIYEPERLERPGFRRTIAAALSMEDALDVDTSALSDPAVNAPGQSHRGASATERAAAWALLPKSGTKRMKVLRAIYDAGARGLTHGEIAQVTGMYHYTAGPRCTELKEGRWVRDSGETRLSAHGKPASVWVMTDAGLAKFRAHLEGAAAA